MPSFLDFQHGTSVELAYANKYNMAIEFTHLPSALSVRFKAYITNWADSFQSNYNSAQVYGRNDPIMTFQGTQRTISLSWKVIAADIDEAIDNVDRINQMAKFLYPGYETNSLLTDISEDPNITVGTLAKAPLLKVRFANLIQDGNGTETLLIDEKAYDQGLVVALGGLDISMELDDGGFDAVSGATIRSNSARPGGTFFPKTFTLSTTMTVLHQHNVGWDESGNWMGPTNYPYNSYAEEELIAEISYEPGESTDQTSEAEREEVIASNFTGVGAKGVIGVEIVEVSPETVRLPLMVTSPAKAALEETAVACGVNSRTET